MMNERGVHLNRPTTHGRCEVLAIRGETDRVDVRCSVNERAAERAAERTSAHRKNLGAMTAPGGEPQAVLAKPDTTHWVLIVDLEYEADVERPGFARVIEREPILAILPGIDK